MIQDSTVNTANGKTIMMMIIDGDARTPKQIADDLGMTGSVDSSSLATDITQIVHENMDIATKIKKTGKQGPIMHLVGKIMKKHNNRVDPQTVKKLIEEEISKLTD